LVVRSVPTRDPAESFKRKRAGSGKTKVLPNCQVASTKVAEWQVVSAIGQNVNEVQALRSGNAFGREAGETNTAQPAYRKLHGTQVLCSAGNGIRETLVTALSEKS
jgi:hypothetical protein